MRIPFAIQSNVRMKERGDYAGGQGPRGMVVHVTAGHFERGLGNALDVVRNGAKRGHTYLCGSRTGELVQAHDIMKWGYHAGESAWRVPLKRVDWRIAGSVSDDLIGYEMTNAEKLVLFEGECYPYWAFEEDSHKFIPGSKPLPKDQIRYISAELAKVWGCPKGYYHKCSSTQEDTLIRTIMWLYVNVEPFKLEYVVGHHEVSGLLGLGYWRKVDPGGSLSLPMPEFRKYLIENKSALIAKYGIKKEV